MLHRTDLQTDNQSEQRNMSGMVTLFCDWLVSVRAAGNRIEWERDQTQFSEQMKHTAQKFGLVSRLVICSTHFSTSDSEVSKSMGVFLMGFWVEISCVVNTSLKDCNVLFTEVKYSMLLNTPLVKCEAFMCL